MLSLLRCCRGSVVVFVVLLALTAATGRASAMQWNALLTYGASPPVTVGETIWLEDDEYSKPSIVLDTPGGKLECEDGSNGDGLWGKLTGNPNPKGALEFEFSNGTGILGGNPNNYCSNNFAGGALRSVGAINTGGFPWKLSLSAGEVAVITGAPSAMTFSVKFSGGEQCIYTAKKLKGTFPVGLVPQEPAILFSAQKLKRSKASGRNCIGSGELTIKFWGMEAYGQIWSETLEHWAEVSLY